MLPTFVLFLTQSVLRGSSGQGNRGWNRGSQMWHPTSAAAGNRSQGKLDLMADLLTSRAERISWPFFPVSCQMTPLSKYWQKQCLFLSCTSAATWRISLDPTVVSSDLGNGILQARLHCHLNFATPRAEWRQWEKDISGYSLGLKEWISVETFKFFAFQGVPHSFWKWELHALWTVFHRVWEPADKLQEYECLQTSSCSSQQAGRDFTQGFPGGHWGEGLPAFSSLLTEVT